MQYGCGVLFLNYLRFQLGLSLTDVCTAAGPTLAARYQQLTGNTDDPLKTMNDLLNKHFQTNVQLANNNPFPLFDAVARKVFLQFGPPVSHTRQELPGMAHLSPFLLCPAKDYGYHWMRSSVTQTVTATTLGFGNPQFTWKINAFPLYLASSSGSTPADVAVANPNAPGSPTHKTGDFSFNYNHQETGALTAKSSTLSVTNTSFEGDYTVILSVEVTEAVEAGQNPVSAEQAADFAGLWVDYDAAYEADREKCAQEFVQRIDHFPKLESLIQIIKTLPDPPSERQWERVVEALLELREQVRELAGHNPSLARKVAQYASWRLGLGPKALLGAAPSESTVS